MTEYLSTTAEKPAARYRLPAEWERQAGVQLTWPHAGTDWAPMLSEITQTYVEMARAITSYEALLVVTPEPEEVGALLRRELTEEQMTSVTLFRCDTNDTWARDHGFLSLVREEGDGQDASARLLLLDFQFNGWGKKFEAEKDNAINAQLLSSLHTPHSTLHGTYENHLDFVLEGGSIESDGKGTVFTTTCCLLAPNRNEQLFTQTTKQPNNQTTKQPNNQTTKRPNDQTTKRPNDQTTKRPNDQTTKRPNDQKSWLDQQLRRRLHARRIVWLDCEPMAGDDTDGHIDTMVRLAPDNTILYNAHARTREQLLTLRTLDGQPYRLIELPVVRSERLREDAPAGMTSGVGEEPLPATYANFLILNGAVLVPTYGQPDSDAAAMQLIATAFPGREIIGIDSRSIIKQHGSIHCCTMQFPSVE